MVEFVDSQTGEVSSEVVEKSFALTNADRLRAYQPTGPVEIEQYIREAVGLLEQMPDVLLEINQRRYDAERAYSRRKNEQMAFYGRQGMAVSFARAQAEVDAQGELQVWFDAKAEYHYAEDTERALRSKLMSMLNVNRSLATQYGATR